MRLGKNDGKVGVALAVLRHVKIPRNDVSVHTYSNGREQGLFLSQCYSLSGTVSMGKERAVSFAEGRSCDSIVVQFGIRKDFNDYGVLSEEVYKTNKKYFDYGQHEKAANFVTKWLKGTR